MNTAKENILMDKWGRQMDYLRIAVTDRCNLRCFYCMPAEGIQYLPKKDLLSYEEIIRITQILAELGVKKVRITGGEPFLRKDLMSLLHQIKSIDGIESLNLTTNGVLTYPHLDELKDLGIDHVNLSLDSLDRNNFLEITRRDEFDKVMDTLHGLVARNIKTKINMVVMQGKNHHEVSAMARLAEDKNISVRFIEEMPFNGSTFHQEENWNATQILNELRNSYPTIEKIADEKNSPSTEYQIPEFKGTVGIIAAYTRTFCGTCNRLRITATGHIKNCLYDEGVLDTRQLLRGNYTDQEIKAELLSVVQKKEANGFLAEANRKNNAPITESMSTIGG
ncbi:GTP 3',8-cyclase MoaA [Reichenbachiella agarivorans]|uniref:GTP 3',8-cyclase n=1 Tax=Reichenbachiella agarivorans TaxID=2979464 RepID=A0ABY6CPL5_9BACT|nr:GTP 3',8-cyclase MoaA [Reichenbachiella agarivorans]UXP32469.1 GTP 3',8-cyclase MoaA [Reichenbachiella agarivorans]